LVGELSSFTFERIALLANARALGFNLTMKFEVFFAALSVGFDEFFCGVDDPAIIVLHQPISLRCLPGQP
jgi:hypothetical protein